VFYKGADFSVDSPSKAPFIQNKPFFSLRIDSYFFFFLMDAKVGCLKTGDQSEKIPVDVSNEVLVPLRERSSVITAVSSKYNDLMK